MGEKNKKYGKKLTFSQKSTTSSAGLPYYNQWYVVLEGFEYSWVS